MKNLYSAVLLCFGLTSLPACTQITVLPSASEQNYQLAVSDAALVREKEISQDLVAITDKNSNLIWNADKSKILVVTWKEQSSYEKFFKPNHASSSNPEHATWVTTAPQVQKFCENYLTKHLQADKAQLDLRLKQYLGLNADWNYDVFIEMWVSPADLFRPCVDPEITDTQCNLQFSEKLPQVKNIPDYVSFYKNLYFKSFRASAGVPWTGLGYTYDWGNPQSPLGASEFILAPQSEYKIERVISTQDYCQPAH
jgi:hypothetical protein